MTTTSIKITSNYEKQTNSSELVDVLKCLKSSNVLEKNLYQKGKKYLKECELNLKFINKLSIFNNGFSFIINYLSLFILDYKKIQFIQTNAIKRNIAILELKKNFSCSCINVYKMPMSKKLKRRQACDKTEKVLTICKKCKKKQKVTIVY